MGNLLSVEDDFDGVSDGEFADELLAEEGIEGFLLRSLRKGARVSVDGRSSWIGLTVAFSLAVNCPAKVERHHSSTASMRSSSVVPLARARNCSVGSAQ